MFSDAYVAADAGHVTLLSLLDLSSAFDSVDHHILIERLRRTYGFGGSALDWIQSYLTGRTQFVRYDGTHVGHHIGDMRGPTGVRPWANILRAVHGRCHQAD